MPRHRSPAARVTAPAVAASALVALLAASSAQAATFPRYRVVDLGPGEARASQPQLGVVGVANDGQVRRWVDGQVLVLPTPKDYGDVIAFNAAGTAAGAAWTGQDWLSVTWSADGTMHDVGLPGMSTSLTGLDDAGTVIGLVFIQGSAKTGFVVAPDGTQSAFPMYGAGDTSIPWAIGPDGTIGAEINGTPGGDRRCALYADGNFTVLPGLSRYHYCQPVAINRAGHVLATAGDANYGQHAVLWRDGGAPIDLGSFGGGAWAVGMNASDVVVGVSGKRLTKKTENFVWAEGVMRSLDTLMDESAAGWKVVRVDGIDDEGRISAQARFTGKRSPHAVLLVPVGK